MKRAVAPASMVFDGLHRCAAKLALTRRTFDDLSLRTLWDPGFANRKPSSKQPPQPFPEYGLLVGAQNRAAGQRTTKLADECSLRLTNFRAVRARKACDWRFAVRAAMAFSCLDWISVLAWVKEQAKNAASLNFDIQA